MPSRRDDAFDADEAYEDDFEDEGDSAVDDDDEPTVPCPFCRADIWEDAPRCPRCGNAIGGTDMPPPRRPWWVVITAALLLYVIVRSLLP
jgi:hypothetical protein